ncbi:MAG: pyrimidine/purine nucleoside phosphorylase [Halarcobacter sp.]
MSNIIEKRVDLIKKANIYFDGKITSRNYTNGEGVIKSLGVMLPGDYSFDTKAAENIEIISGKVEVLFGGMDSNWETFKDGESFDIPANSSFEIKVDEITDYCCTYL